MNTAHARPVTILTGFLGAGKTTFLNALMKSYPKKRFAIIENEIGQLNIDSSLLNENYGQLVALQEGCLCCTLNDVTPHSNRSIKKRTALMSSLLNVQVLLYPML